MLRLAARAPRLRAPVTSTFSICSLANLSSPSPVLPRRTFNTQAIAAAAALCGTWPDALASPPHPQAKWHTAALDMLRLAQSWGDQPYGAVLVLGDAVVGEGPSLVVKDNNPDAHAERVALLDAQRRLGRADLAGAVLYSTS